jgi:hypothetical protein
MDIITGCCLDACEGVREPAQQGVHEGRSRACGGCFTHAALLCAARILLLPRDAQTKGPSIVEGV